VRNWFKWVWLIDKKLWLFLFIFLIAFVLRIYKVTVEYGYFGDQGRDLLVVFDWIRHGNMPLIGPVASVGAFHLGPFFYYLICPFLLIFQFNPFGPVALALFCGLSLIVLTYLYFSKWGDYPTAIFSSILLAFSPVAIFISRGDWNPNVQPLFFLLLLYFLTHLIKKGGYRYIFLVFLVLGIGIQLHYTFAANILATVIILLIYKPRVFIDYRFWLSSLAGFIGPNIPFLLGQFQTNFFDITNLWQYLTGGSESKALPFLFQTVIDRTTFPLTVYFPTYFFSWFLKLFVTPIYLLILIIVVVIAFTKNSVSFPARLLLIFFAVGVTVSGFLKIDFLEHYYEEFAVSVVLFAGLIVSYLYTQARIKLLWVLVLFLFLFWQVSNFSIVYKVSRTSGAVFRESQTILNDIPNNKKNIYGIYYMTPISLSEGYELRYLLEINGIRTFSSRRPDLADYLVMESSSQKMKLPKLRGIQPQLVGNLSFDADNEVIKDAAVYRLMSN